jgi:simple sugar transport system permease protein
MEKSILGYEIRSVGYNRLAAQTAGINIGRIVIISMLMSGAVGGLAGSMQVLGVDKRFIVGFSPGYGFNGIAVAALAADHPLGVVFASIIFGALNAGSMVLNRTTRIPTDFINVIQGLVIIFVSAPALVREIVPFRRNRHV